MYSETTETGILDQANIGAGYSFVPSPVWFSVSLPFPSGTVARVTALQQSHQLVQLYLRECYEAGRAGVAPPPMSDRVREILWPELREVKSDKQPKRRATGAALSTE